MKTVAIIAARMNSTRFPGKVLEPLDGELVLEWVIDAAARALWVDEVWVATTRESRDDAIAKLAADSNACVYRGSETDVLGRYAECAAEAKADIVVRLTGDCPFADPAIIDQVSALRAQGEVSYAHNVSPATWPDGLDVEVFTRQALDLATAEATRGSDRDCLTQYLERNRARFANAALICPIPGLANERWVLDTEDDMAFCQTIAKRLRARPAGYTDILRILQQEPELRELNKKHSRNERFFAAVAQE